MTATDEKDLPTKQSPAQTHARFSLTDGEPRRAQGAQTPAGEGAQTPDRLDSGQTTGLGRRGKFAFGLGHRLHSSREFTQVQRRGTRVHSQHFIVCALGDYRVAGPRLGITVSRRVGRAVVRNRVKRRVRECFRLWLSAILPERAALVVIAKTGAGEIASVAVNDELRTATLAVVRRLRT